MSEWLNRFTSLPNLHPALVHFPIALLPVAVLLDLALLAVVRQRDWLDRAAALLYLAAGLGALAAYRSGEQAADSVGLTAPAVELALTQHANWGRYSMWLLGALAVVRIILSRRDGLVRWLGPRAALALVAVGAVGLVFRTADLGGRLVFRHGVAVEPVAQRPDVPDSRGGLAAPPGDARSGLIEHPDGSLEWRPGATEGEAARPLHPAPASDAGAVTWSEPRLGAPGVALEVDGEAILLLPGTHGDVQVELEVAPGDFAGEIGVVHHARAASELGFLTARLPSGSLVLGSRRGGVESESGRARASLPSGPVRLSVSAVGRHFKGYLGSELLVHGHEPELPAGACGILIRGRGELSILSVKVTPVEGGG